MTDAFRFEHLSLPEVVHIVPRKIPDVRGEFVKTLVAEQFRHNAINPLFVENFESESRRGVVRGLHYQLDPCAEGKLVRVTRGRVFDVVVDVRRGSPRFGKWTAAYLSDEAYDALWVPPGFAHGFLALEEPTRVLYQVTSSFCPEHYRGIRWNDSAIGIEWPSIGVTIASEKDGSLPELKDAETNYQYTEKGPLEES
ncbi:MAG: dTDP-4-dehydrorhamnose 3,5-epimerase [Patescibacteria group bacterium]|nr:dTDP-4-dehydrorhamnose 3,5-epimerase [Patescibacteria group bacterium]